MPEDGELGFLLLPCRNDDEEISRINCEALVAIGTFFSNFCRVPDFSTIFGGDHTCLRLFLIGKGGVSSPLFYFCFSDGVTLDIEVNLTSCIPAFVLIACVDNDLSSSL